MRLLLLVSLLVLYGCGDELAAAKAAAAFWKQLAIVGIVIALLIGIAMGSRGKS